VWCDARIPPCTTTCLSVTMAKHSLPWFSIHSAHVRAKRPPPVTGRWTGQDMNSRHL
jgi:hypothetical protein